jgi:hypothetical protein
MIAGQQTSLAQRIVRILVSSLIFLAGCAFLYLFLLQPYLLRIAARQWNAVPCHILASKVEENSDKHGLTYTVKIKYAYTVNGKDYRCTRYQFTQNATSAREPKARVVAHYQRGSAVVCYVNPKNPSEAVLDRETVPPLWFGLFPLVFMGIGAMGAVLSIRGKATSSSIPGGADSSLSGGEPWLLRPDWASLRIVSNTKAMRNAWVFAGAWNAFCIPFTGAMLFAGHPHGHQPDYVPAGIAMLFLIVGLFLLFRALTLTRRKLRFGQSILELASVPCGLGGALEGTIRPERPIRTQAPVKLHLKCLSRTTVRTSDGRSTTEAILWQHAETVEQDTSDGIPVAISIPADGQETTTIDRANGTFWRLEASASCPGVDYAESFELPVFRVALTPEQSAGAAKAAARERDELTTYVQPAGSRIRVQGSLEGGKEFFYPACRNLSASVPALIVLLIIAGIFWSVPHAKLPLPFSLFLGFMEIILTLTLIYGATATKHVVVNQEGVTITSTLLGIRRSKSVPRNVIDSVKTQPGMTVGSTVYSDLRMVCRDTDGDSYEVTAGKSIKDTQEAEWLAAEMTKALGQRQAI